MELYKFKIPWSNSILSLRYFAVTFIFLCCSSDRFISCGKRTTKIWSTIFSKFCLHSNTILIYGNWTSFFLFHIHISSAGYLELIIFVRLLPSALWQLKKILSCNEKTKYLKLINTYKCLVTLHHSWYVSSLYCDTTSSFQKQQKGV